VQEQIAVLLAANEGVFDRVPLSQVGAAERAVRRAAVREVEELAERIRAGEAISEEDREAMLSLANAAVAALPVDEDAGND